MFILHHSFYTPKHAQLIVLVFQFRYHASSLAILGKKGVLPCFKLPACW